MCYHQSTYNAQVEDVAVKRLPEFTVFSDDDGKINELLRMCHNGKSLMITSMFNASGEVARSIYNRSCFPLEISTSQAARSMGHCSDFIMYIFYTGARLSADYGQEATMEHALRCPNSSFLHGEYPIPGLFHVPDIRNYWMPNVEQVKKEAQEELIPLTYQFLGKTRKSVEVINDYFENHSLPGTASFMSHSSPDPLSPLMRDIEPNYNSFYHAYGHSGRKGTPELLQCWANRSDFPMLTVLGQNSYEAYQNISNIKIIQGHLDVNQVRVLQRSHGVHICPSSMEGYGHYISEARGMGAMVVTTDFGPMNEFVINNYSGILISAGRVKEESYMAFRKIAVDVSEKDICIAIETVLSMPLKQRKIFGSRGRILYEISREEMKDKLKKLKRETVEFFSSRVANTMSWEEIDDVLLKQNKFLMEYSTAKIK